MLKPQVEWMKMPAFAPLPADHREALGVLKARLERAQAAVAVHGVHDAQDELAQVHRPPRALQLVELALPHRLLDAMLGQPLERRSDSMGRHPADARVDLVEDQRPLVDRRLHRVPDQHVALVAEQARQEGRREDQHARKQDETPQPAGRLGGEPAGGGPGHGVRPPDLASCSQPPRRSRP